MLHKINFWLLYLYLDVKYKSVCFLVVFGFWMEHTLVIIALDRWEFSPASSPNSAYILHPWISFFSCYLMAFLSDYYINSTHKVALWHIIFASCSVSFLSEGVIGPTSNDLSSTKGFITHWLWDMENKLLNLFDGKTHPAFLTGLTASNKRCFYIVRKSVCVCVCV